MGVYGAEQQLCPCYKECQEFHKLVELKDTGLVVYCHSTRIEDVRQGEEDIESAVNTSRDVFILHNTKDVKILPSDLTPELEKKDISCPRCRKIFEHAQELIQQVKSIDKNNVVGICDHCRKKTQANKNPCIACEEIVKKFISVKGEQKEDIKKYVKIWLSKMGLLLKDTIDKPKKIETRAYSDLQINRLCQHSPARRREPEVQQMFHSDTHKSDTNLYTEMSDDNFKKNYALEKSVAFNQPTESVETSVAVTPHKGEKINTMFLGPSLDESDITFVEPFVGVQEHPKTSLKDRKPEEISQYYDDSSVDAKEAIKKRHDLSLRHMMRLEKDSGTPYSVSKRPEIYEIPKIAPWEQQKFTRDQYNVSEFDDESTLDVRGAPKKKHLSSKTSQKSLRRSSSEQYRVDKYDRSKIKKETNYSEEGLHKMKKREDRYLTDEELKSQRSLAKFSHKTEKPGQQVLKSKSKDKKALEPKETVENILKSKFSFFFPKGKDKERKHNKLDARSSQLIKNTQEKLRLQAEREKQIEEEKRQQKIEEHEKKKLAREEKKHQAEEKKKETIEDQKKYADEQKRVTEGKKYTERDLERESVSEEDKKRREDEKRHDKSKVDKSELKGKSSKHSDEGEKESKRKTEPRNKLNEETERSKKDLKSKPEQRDKTDEVLQKAKKDLKSTPEQREKIAEVSEKAKKDLKSQPEQRDKIDEISEKAKKGVKEKSETKGKGEDVTEKEKKGLKEKPEPKQIDDDVMEKDKKGVKEKRKSKDKEDEIMEKGKKDLKKQRELRDRDDEIMEKRKKDIKEKRESKDKGDDVPEKSKKGLKEKSELKDKGDKVTEKGKKGLQEYQLLKDGDDEITVTVKDKKDTKLKTEQKDKIYEVSEKGKKDSSKPEQKEKSDKSAVKEKKAKTDTKEIDMDKEMALALKQREKEERDEILQRNKEEKERLKQVEQLRKEKEAQKKQAAKEEESSRKKGELSKEKEAPSKQTEKSSKGKVESPKKEEPAGEIEVSMSKIQISSKEPKEVSIKQQDKPKDKKEKKEEISKDAEERSKKKQDTSKEKESKGKVSKKEESPKVEESKEESSKKAREAADEAQFKKLQAEHLKEKQEALKRKKQQEIEAQKAKDLADKRAKEEAERKLKSVEAKAVAKTEPKPTSTEESDMKKEEPKKDVLKIHDIKVRNASSDDLILKLVKIKQAATGVLKIRPWDIDPAIIKAHKCHQKSGQMSTLCALCCNSELEIDVESYDNKINLRREKKTDIIIGEKIFKHKPRLEKTKEPEVIPILFQSEFRDESVLLSDDIVQIFAQETQPVKKNILETLLAKKDTNGIDTEPGKGIIRYALSDRTFIDKGWTMLPTEKVVRKMNVYRMRPAHPEFDWFEHNKNKRLMTYDTGERLAEFDDNGRGRWYYRSGRLALDYYDAEETNAQQRFVIYSSGEPDERGRTHPITILATFDYLGNGIVFDHAGKIRLKYNQTEGVVLDRGIGPVSHWKWHTLNDPPVLQQVMIDTQMAHKDPAIIKLGTPADSKARPDNEEMLAIEFDNFIKEKSKKLSQKFKPFQIKMKALKINEHFSLKVLDQATIYLIFRDGSTNLKLNIGMILDHQEIVDTDTAEVGEVSNNLERFPARTDSLAGLQRSVAYAQRYERQRTERERRLRRPEPCASADHLTAAASPPLRPALRTMPTGSTSSAGYCNCRKPTNNLYYNTRLL